MENIIVITGQTATGKTNLALKLAKKYNGELVNCDARQIYKYLDIITGKDLIDKSKTSLAWRRKGDQRSKLKFKIEKKTNNFDIGYYSLKHPNKINIWLYDIVDPKQYFSSYDWVRCAIFVIRKLFNQKITPIIVGGSFFYLRHLLYGVDSENIPPNPQLRQAMEKKSISYLQKTLKTLNSEIYSGLNQSDRNNPRRLIRKIEIYTVKAKNNYQQPRRLVGGLAQQYKTRLIALKFKNKDNLIRAIKTRVEQRIKYGAVEEVADLIQKGYRETDPGLQTIGYKQMLDYIRKKVSKQDAVNQWITKEIQYAKRQYTFMKTDKNIRWELI